MVVVYFPALRTGAISSALSERARRKKRAHDGLRPRPSQYNVVDSAQNARSLEAKRELGSSRFCSLRKRWRRWSASLCCRCNREILGCIPRTRESCYERNISFGPKKPGARDLQLIADEEIPKLDAHEARSDYATLVKKQH